MSQHTKEPWAVTCDRSRAGAYNDIGNDSLDWPENKVAMVVCDNPSFLANQERIVACVNALEGVDDPAALLAMLRGYREALIEMVGESAARALAKSRAT